MKQTRLEEVAKHILLSEQNNNLAKIVDDITNAFETIDKYLSREGSYRHDSQFGKEVKKVTGTDDYQDYIEALDEVLHLHGDFKKIKAMWERLATDSKFKKDLEL